jgi:hypothetical protein
MESTPAIHDQGESDEFSPYDDPPAGCSSSGHRHNDLRRLKSAAPFPGLRRRGSRGVPSGSRRGPVNDRETTRNGGVAWNENAQLTGQIGPSLQVREPIPATLPRWGSRVRVPSSAPEKPPAGPSKLPGVRRGSRLVHDFVIEPLTHSEGHCTSLEDLAAAN